jgi:hypothetical protein
MESGLPKLIGIVMLLLLMSSFQVVVPAQAQVATAQPVWITINASAQGNYPGGDELFTVFVVNSAQTPTENVTINSMTLTAPFGSNNAIGLPAVLSPGQSILATISLGIPSNFTERSFNANLVVQGRIWNGTGYKPISATGTADVGVFALSSQPASQGGSISTTLFAAAVAIPSIVTIILLVLLVRARASSKRMRG